MKSDPLETLTGRQRRFIAEYVRDPVGARAALASGYSKRGASRTANRLLKDPIVAAEVGRLNGEVTKEAQVDAKWVIENGVMLYKRLIGEIRPILDRKGNHVQDACANFLFEFDAANALRSLELVGKAVKAFSDTSEDASKGAPLPVSIIQFIVNGTERAEVSVDVQRAKAT